MDEGDETVGLAATVLGAETDDGGDFAALARETLTDGAEEFFEAASGISEFEKAGGIAVNYGGFTGENLGEVGGVLLVFGRAGFDVVAGTAGGEDGGEVVSRRREGVVLYER